MDICSLNLHKSHKLLHLHHHLRWRSCLEKIIGTLEVATRATLHISPLPSDDDADDTVVRSSSDAADDTVTVVRSSDEDADDTVVRSSDDVVVVAVVVEVVTVVGLTSSFIHCKT